MKAALDKNDAYVEASPDAPEVATCPDCSGIVDLRSRQSWSDADRKLGSTAIDEEKAGTAHGAPDRDGDWDSG